MKILVTGATGFIGQNLATKLIEANHEVYALVRKNSDTACINRQVKLHMYDKNMANLIDFFKKEKFDGIIHLASLFLASHSPDDIGKLITSNIQFGTELLEVARSSNVTWFLNTGTFWQNYENESYNPVNFYAATKEAFETMAKFYTQTSDLVFTTIKLNDTFGINDTRAKVFNLWTKIAASGERLEMSAGEQIIDISYIDDVISAYMQLVKCLEENATIHKNKTYVVTNEEKLMLKDLAKVFEKATDSKLNIGWGGRDYRYREVMSPYSLGETIPGWKQQYTLEEAIRKTVKDLQND